MNDPGHRTAARAAEPFLQPIQRPRQLSLAEQVRQRLSASISSGSLHPDQVIVVEQLAAMLNVSKTPVREALGMLQRDGLIRQNGNGFEVPPLDAEYVREVYAVRRALESLAAEIIAPMLTDDDLRELEDAVELVAPHLDESREQYRAGPDSEWWRRNIEFHIVLLSKCPWPYLGSLLETIQAHRARVSNLEFGDSPESRQVSYRDHRAILEALKQRDGALAGELMRAHLGHPDVLRRQGRTESVVTD